MKESILDPWLRGPISGVPMLLQPVAHTFVHVGEEIPAVVSDLSLDQIWRRIGDAASIGFHLLHLAGSTDRLMTYARGDPLSESQHAALLRERAADKEQPSAEELLQLLQHTVAGVLAQLRVTAESGLCERRLVGKAELPSTVLGLLFHAAEHASRHAGQVVTTARILT